LPVLPLTFELSFDNFHTSTQVSPDLARWRLRRRSVRKLRHTLLAAQREARKSGSQEQTQIIASAIGKPAAKAPTIVKVNAESKFISRRNCSTDMAACSTPRKVKKPSPARSGDGF